MKINWIKFWPVYVVISSLVLGAGIYSLLTWGLNLGVDFKGGAVLEYKLSQNISTEEVISKLKEKDIEATSIQTTKEGTYIIKTSDLSSEKRDTPKQVLTDLNTNPEEVRFENVGPSIGPELIKKTFYAIAAASIVILLWIAFQFKNLSFGGAALLAMFHDTLVLVGMFSLLGHFADLQTDFLFVTAVLTTLSFSVHDTIVVFDRIREIKKSRTTTLADVANESISVSMRRSINNSLTIIFVLTSLVILGGSSIQGFAAALLIGTISGTYSSPFVAVPLLVLFQNLQTKFKK